MINGWQKVQLGDVLQRVKAELAVDDSVTYKQVTVRLWNKGVVLRGEQEGLTIKTKRQFFVKTGQLLMSRIDVRNGAIGLVPKELDGAIVSNDFWVYDFDKSKLFPKYLAHYVTTPGFIEDANRTSSGTTKRIRAEETAFLNINIPLPPLEEQYRIVERIEALAVNIIKAKSLREEANEGVELLIKSERHQIFGNMDLEKFGKPLSEVAEFLDGKRIPLNKHQRDEKKPGNIPYYGASGIVDYINEWVFDDTLLLISEDGANIEMRSKPIAFVITGKTWVNNHSHVLKFKDDITAYYLAQYIEHSDVTSLWRGATRPKINKSALEKFIVPIPPLDEQRRIVAYLDSVQARLASLRELQSQTGEELDALLPSILDKAFKGEL